MIQALGGQRISLGRYLFNSYWCRCSGGYRLILIRYRAFSRARHRRRGGLQVKEVERELKKPLHANSLALCRLRRPQAAIPAVTG